jgi:hypothetical protein
MHGIGTVVFVWPGWLSRGHISDEDTFVPRRLSPSGESFTTLVPSCVADRIAAQVTILFCLHCIHLIVLVLGGVVLEDQRRTPVLLHILIYCIALLANQACAVAPVHYYLTAPERAQKPELKEG